MSETKFHTLYSNVYVFRADEKKKVSKLNGSKHYPNSVSSFSSWIKFRFVTVIPKYLYCATFSKVLLGFFILYITNMANYWSEQKFHQVFKNYINTHLHVSASTSQHQNCLQHWREILYMYAIHKYICVRIIFWYYIVKSTLLLKLIY
jgi:hypothetical protein